MQQYIGTKMIEARSMDLGDYNIHRGWKIPGDENPDRPGYNVIYPDGYESWSPQEAFDEAYRPTSSMNFGLAIAAMQKGCKVARAGWNGKNMFIFLVPGSRFVVNRPPLLGIYAEGTEIDYHSHIDMRTANGQIVPWLASQTDMLADDWVIVEDVIVPKSEVAA